MAFMIFLILKVRVWGQVVTGGTGGIQHAVSNTHPAILPTRLIHERLDNVDFENVAKRQHGVGTSVEEQGSGHNEQHSGVEKVSGLRNHQHLCASVSGLGK